MLMFIMRLQRSAAVVLVLYTCCLLTALVHAQQINNDSPVCQGIFDFYFVLDSSGSVDDFFQSEIVPFVSNVTDHYEEPDFRIAVVTFATESVVHLNLTRTADRSELEAGVQRLREFQPGGNTYLAPGLTNVNNIMDRMGGDAASVVLVLTDANILDENQALQQAKLARSQGATIFAIGIGEVNQQQLSMIADDAEQVYTGSDFQYLNEILNTVVNKTCIEITSVTPNKVCIGATSTVTLVGRGFTNNLNQDSVACRFKTNGGQFFVTNPTEIVEYDSIICPVPDFNQSENVLLQVSTNGISFISSNVTMEISECKGVSAGAVVGALAVVSLVAVVVIALLLWFFFPLITGKVIKKRLPPQPERPKGTSGRNWSVVDASYYGGRGAGGINQMKVQWGAKGATEEGSKLEHAKDANMIAIVSVPGTPGQPKPSCWDLTKAKFLRWYAIATSHRPVFTVNGPVRHVSWCPGERLTKYGVQADNA